MSQGFRLNRMVILSALSAIGLIGGSEVADGSPIQVAHLDSPNLGIEGPVLADDALAEVRGMGSGGELPAAPKGLAVILWDEGKSPGRSTSRNQAAGSGNLQTHRASYNGR